MKRAIEMGATKLAIQKKAVVVIIAGQSSSSSVAKAAPFVHQSLMESEWPTH